MTEHTTINIESKHCNKEIAQQTDYNFSPIQLQEILMDIHQIIFNNKIRTDINMQMTSISEEQY